MLDEREEGEELVRGDRKGEERRGRIEKIQWREVSRDMRGEGRKDSEEKDSDEKEKIGKRREEESMMEEREGGDEEEKEERGCNGEG